MALLKKRFCSTGFTVFCGVKILDTQPLKNKLFYIA